MAWTQALLRLQDVDIALTENAKRQRTIEAELRENAALAEAERGVKQADKAADAARRAQETVEFELGQVQVKRDLTESNLYSGRITNSRELQDLQAELQSLKRRVSTLEDELLEAMMAREDADATAKAAHTRLRDVQARLGSKHAALTAEQEALGTEAAALESERETLRGQVPPSIIDAYDYLKDRTAGMPVAQMKGDACSVCGTELLRPTQQAVQRGQEAYCDNCRRLVVG